MALNHFAKLGMVALGSALIFGMAGCSSSDDDNNNNTGGIGGMMPQGGMGGALPGGGAGGTTPAPVTCGDDLLGGLVPLGDTNNWVGGEPAAVEDNPCGIQGAIYIYGDYDSATVNSACTPAKDTTPCTKDPVTGKVRCCMSGNTVVDKPDYNAWGCGLGLSLNDPGKDAAGVAQPKLPYAGTAVGFTYTIEGTTAGQDVRIGYSQLADTTGLCSPFQNGTKWGPSIPAKDINAGLPITNTVRFSEVACPDGANEDCGCTTGAVPFDFQIQVSGGDKAGEFNLCLTSLTPIMQ